MDQKITPTIGRVVLFRHNGACRFMNIIDEQPMKADVVFVHPEGAINVSVFDHKGFHHTVHKVTLVQPGDETHPASEPYCEWMPFQKGQAPASDAVLKRLAALEEVAGIAPPGTVASPG